MLALATNRETKIKVSKMELEMPDQPYTVETLARLKNELHDTEIFFVMGADSWQDITTWREWEKVLTMTNIIVVTRPDYEIGFSHVTEEIRAKIVDLRENRERRIASDDQKIYVTDAVQLDVSATEIRDRIRENDPSWREDVPEEVAKYLEKYQIYR